MIEEGDTLYANLRRRGGQTEAAEAQGRQRGQEWRKRREDRAAAVAKTCHVLGRSTTAAVHALLPLPTEAIVTIKASFEERASVTPE